MTDDVQQQFLERLRTRRAFDDRWQLWDFVAYKVFLSFSILASFGSAILAASNVVSPLVVALVAAIPGTIIVIDRGFLFSRRWRWHNTMSTKLTALEHRLLFESATVKEVSEAYSALLIEMETVYPRRDEIEGIGHEAEKHVLPPSGAPVTQRRTREN